MGRQSCSATCDDNCRPTMADLDDELAAIEDDQVKDIKQADNVARWNSDPSSKILWMGVRSKGDDVRRDLA